ncbi:Predicted membrane protein [Klebsiella pneumoniae]|nr:Predicted membrane protein [Klebsiella pneumoniae]
MIIRPEQHWFLRLFDWHGSVLSKIIFRLLLNVLMSIIAIISYQWYEQLGIHLTVAPFSLLGIAIAIFLGFRNSASYSRFVEARNLWGTVLIAERTLVRQLRNILPAEHDAHRRIVSYLVAFSWSLKHQLRKTEPTADLRRLLPEERVTEILASSNAHQPDPAAGRQRNWPAAEGGQAQRHHLRADGQQTRRAGARAGRL